MPKEQITSLTPAQESQLPIYRDKGIEIGTSTNRLVESDVTAAIHELYECGSLDHPEEIVIAESPVEVLKTASEKSGIESDTLKVQFCYGNMDSYWIMFYKFFRDEVNLVEETKKLTGLISTCNSCGWFIPFDKLCVVSQKPVVCSLVDGVLHKEDGPAIEYSDGFSIYSLNGVRVPEWLVQTTEEKLDPLKIHQIENAQVRREFVRKIGIDRLLSKLGSEVIDEGTDINGNPCKLHLLKMGDNTKRPYIELENASLPGVLHVEGVPPDCRTIDAAMEFRNGTNESPSILT